MVNGMIDLRMSIPLHVIVRMWMNMDVLSFYCTYELVVTPYFPLYDGNGWLVIAFYSVVYDYFQGYIYMSNFK